MRLLLPAVLALPLVACHAVSAPRLPDSFAVAREEPNATASYFLYKFLQRIGNERDTFTPTPTGGVEAKASFTFNDRGNDVPLAASARLDRDGRLERFDAWGFVARGAPLDDHVLALGDGRFAVRRLRAPARTVTPAGPYGVASGYAPMLGQELLARAWIAAGRPARLGLLPEGEVAITSRGHERYTLEGHQLDFEHLAIDGLAWGREDIWLDGDGKLAAVVTRDAEYDHFEGVRTRYAPLIEGLVARAGADAIAGLAAAVQASGNGQGGLTALVGGRLIDVSGGPTIDDAVVVYDGDRILAAGPRAVTPVPAGARRVDVRGKSILPGLWDMHAHVEQVEQAAVYLAAGVTTVRDMGNIMSFITAMRDTIDSGRGVGPRIIVNGLVDSTGPQAIGTLRVDSEADIAPMIEQLVQAHCAELKIYSSLKVPLIKPLVAEAHRRGLRVTGHLPEGIDVNDAIDAGFDGLNHVDVLARFALPKTRAERDKLSPPERIRRLLALDESNPALARAFARMAEKHIMFDPTMALDELFSFPAAELERREPGIAKLPHELRDSFSGVGLENAAERAALFRRMLALVGAAHRRGVPVVAGTDQAILGHSLHREIELYVEAGFTPLEALQAATLVPARLLGRERVAGTVAVGKQADLLVVDGNPLADIRDTRKVTLVVARGRAYTPAPLWKQAGFQP